MFEFADNFMKWEILGCNTFANSLDFMAAKKVKAIKWGQTKMQTQTMFSIQWICNSNVARHFYPYSIGCERVDAKFANHLKFSDITTIKTPDKSK